MIGIIELRPYQTTAIERINDAWDGGMRRAAVVLPTGAGKTVVFAALIGEWVRDNFARRVVVVVHREELITQTVDKIRRQAPHLSVGVVKAERDEIDATVIVASVQTLAVKGRAERLRDVGLVVVDECHHYAAKSWKGVLARLKCFDEDSRVSTVGFTATMSRGDGAGLGGVWEDVVYRRDILRMIMDGYLCDVEGRSVTVDGLDLSQVARKAGGDFADGSLGDALLSSGAAEAVAKAYLDHAVGRRAIAFAPTVAFAHAISGALNTSGVKTEVLSGETPASERHGIYERFRTGATSVIANCMVLTEGFDAPWAEVCILARPTRSTGLYTQIVGRVLRPWVGKEKALLIDLCGSTADNTLCGLIDLSDTVPEVKVGETILEAVERVEREANARGTAPEFERMTHARADMFAKQVGSWLFTEGRKTPFIRTKLHTYLLWSSAADGTFMIGRYDNKFPRGHEGPRESLLRETGVWMIAVPCAGWTTDRSKAECLPIEYAMSWADAEAVDEDKSIASRNAPWRKRAPSPDMKDLARSLGVKITSDMRAGKVSELINVSIVTRQLGG